MVEIQKGTYLCLYLYLMLCLYLCLYLMLYTKKWLREANRLDGLDSGTDYWIIFDRNQTPVVLVMTIIMKNLKIMLIQRNMIDVLPWRGWS